jgi:prepilin-type N-terminal cleavage/methylation domain-containing protein
VSGSLTGGCAPGAAARGCSGAGFTLVELILVLAVAALVVSLAVPMKAAAVDASSARGAAHRLASKFRWARQRAILSRASTAVVFHQAPGGRWSWQVCTDGNGNGVRRAEITAGVDACPDPATTVEQEAPAVHVGVDPSIPGPDDGAATSDPVKLGASDMASFSSAGSASAGTVFLHSPEAQYAVRIGSMTGRTRVLRFDAARRVWSAG